jgi:hypothetical protein
MMHFEPSRKATRRGRRHCLRRRSFMWTVAYQKATGGAVTDQDSALLTDQTMPVDSNAHALPPIAMQSVWGWAGGATLTRVRKNVPKFRGFIRPMLRPIETALSPSSRPIFEESWRSPLGFNATEPISFLQSDTAAETVTIVYTWGDGNRNAPQGDTYTARYTQTSTPLGTAWTISGALTFDDTLPVGQFSIVGWEMFTAGGIAARLTFLGPAFPGLVPNVRPGILVPVAVGSEHSRYFRYGYLGEFGRFQNTALPLFEELATGANSDGYFDLVKVG